jgi:peptide chain release factor 1
VAVLPEAEDVDIAINEADLKIDTLRRRCRRSTSTRPVGGARTHLPTGIDDDAEDRSQHRNRQGHGGATRAAL